MSQTQLDRIEARQGRIEAALVKQQEEASLGHRIIYDTKTGWSTNVAGCYCDPELLDEHGLQVRLR